MTHNTNKGHEGEKGFYGTDGKPQPGTTGYDKEAAERGNERASKSAQNDAERTKIAEEDEAVRMQNSSNVAAKPLSADDPHPEYNTAGDSKPVPATATQHLPPEVRPRPDLDGRVNTTAGYDVDNERQKQDERINREKNAAESGNLPNNEHGGEMQRDLEEDARRKASPEPYQADKS